MLTRKLNGLCFYLKNRVYSFKKMKILKISKTSLYMFYKTKFTGCVNYFLKLSQ